MLNAGSLRRSCVPLLLALLFVTALSGCASKEKKALEQAKTQAAATGQPQQVVTVDKAGNTVTTVVQPPARGQKEPTVETTSTPPPAGAPAPAASGPTVSAVPQPQPPAPVEVSIPAGTSLAIRVDQRISVKTSHTGDQFTGEVVEQILASDNSILVPKGAPVKGIVDASHKRGRFKGASLLELRLTSVTLNGTEYPLETRALAERKKGKGKRSAAFIGGGSGLGMLVGGVATGGVGLLVGGLAGAGARTAAAGFTGKRDIDIPAESVVRFTLADDLDVQEPVQGSR